MATSSINFEGSFALTSPYTRGELEVTFSPPSNIAGKLCYAEVKIFQLMWDSLYAAPAAYDTFVLRGSWAQSQTMNVEYSKQAPSNVPLAVYRYGNAEGKGCPVLVQIPNGPHSVRFTLQRLDSGAMGVDGTHLAFMVQMNIVPADSRQTPLA